MALLLDFKQFTKRATPYRKEINMKNTTVRVKFLSQLDQRSADIVDFVVGDVKVVLGDVVLVNVKGGVALAQVTAFNVQDANANSNILDVMTDASPHLKAIANRVRQAEIRKEIQVRMSKVDEAKQFQMYAESDPEIANLVKMLEDAK